MMKVNTYLDIKKTFEFQQYARLLQVNIFSSAAYNTCSVHVHDLHYFLKWHSYGQNM